ncbi:hypothetical protein HZC53_00505 [Candidatus Uhrbacteria bacterium]|nr:hypothetical protein [Candidatus Uhrbacteria bacterium]
MKNEYLLKHAVMIGVFAVFLYAACLLWRFTMTDPSVMQFHLLSLKTAFPGFSGFDAGSVIYGGVMSFVYGLIISLIFHGLHANCNCCSMKK